MNKSSRFQAFGPSATTLWIHVAIYIHVRKVEEKSRFTPLSCTVYDTM